MPLLPARFGALLIFALLPCSVAQAAGSKAERIHSQLAAGKPQAAWKTCVKLQEKGALAYDDEVEACAEADLQRLNDSHPDGLSLGQLNEHWTRWNGTSAGRRTREAAAQRRLEQANGDVEMLAAIFGGFSDTPAGQLASDLLFQSYVDQNSSVAMEEFARRFPEAPQAERAREMALDLVWRETEEVGTAEVWALFIKANPTHPRLGEAVRWYETLSFRETEAVGTAAAWGGFLSEFPDHPRYKEAEQNRINAMFQECEEKGADAMLAVADAWPDHPLSEITRARAYASMMTVELLSRGYSDPEWSPAAGNIEPVDVVPVGVDGVNVIFPPGQPVAEVDLVYFEGGRSSALGGRYAERLVALSLPTDRVKTMTQVAWLPPQGQRVSGRMQVPLCVPDGTSSWFAVVTRAFDSELVFPFKVEPPCSRAGP